MKRVERVVSKPCPKPRFRSWSRSIASISGLVSPRNLVSKSRLDYGFDVLAQDLIASRLKVWSRNLFSMPRPQVLPRKLAKNSYLEARSRSLGVKPPLEASSQKPTLETSPRSLISPRTVRRTRTPAKTFTQTPISTVNPFPVSGK